MKKGRLEAFSDAILAIIMTILVLELDKPQSLSFMGLWSLRHEYLSYAISFFWLAAMWVNTHNEWQYVEKISTKVVWWDISVLFCSSLVPYVTSILSSDFNSGFAQGIYGIVIVAVTLANIGLNHAVERANADCESLTNYVGGNRRWLFIDLGIKIVGIIISVTLFPPMCIICVFLAGALYIAVVAIRNPVR